MTRTALIITTRISEYQVGDTVKFGGNGNHYTGGPASGEYTGTVELVGRKNLTIRYTKGAGSHLFKYVVDPSHGTITREVELPADTTAPMFPRHLSVACPDCGAFGERAGHQECQFPQDH